MLRLEHATKHAFLSAVFSIFYMPKTILRQYQTTVALAAATWAISNPILMPFLLSRGLDLPMAGLYFAVARLSTLIMEVPTGAFADAYGRKKSVILCFALSIIGFSAFLASHDLALLLFSATIIGAADAFFSGAMEAWAVDRFKEEGFGETHTRALLASGSGVSYGVLLLGGVLGGLVGSWSMEVAIALGFPAMFAGLWYVWRLPEKRIEKEFGSSFQMITNRMADALNQSLRQRRIVILLTISFLIGLGVFRPFVSWQPAFAQLFDWGAAQSGFLFSAFCIMAILGSRYIGVLNNRPGVLATILVLMSVALLVGGWLWAPLASLSFFLLFEIGVGAYKPVLNASLHSESQSHLRATILSLSSAAWAAGFALAGFVFSLSGAISFELGWLISGVLLAAAAVLAFVEKF